MDCCRSSLRLQTMAVDKRTQDATDIGHATKALRGLELWLTPEGLCQTCCTQSLTRWRRGLPSHGRSCPSQVAQHLVPEETHRLLQSRGVGDDVGWGNTPLVDFAKYHCN